MRINRLFIKMIGKSKKLSLLKYVFLCLLVICMTIVTILLCVSKNSNLDLNEKLEDIKYSSLYESKFDESMLDSKFENCFITHFSHLMKNISLTSENIITDKSINASTISDSVNSSLSSNPIVLFSEITQALEIEIILIEPVLLFCLLSRDLKTLLKKRNFTFENYALKNVLTLGIMEKYAVDFEKEYIQSYFKKKGFQTEIVKMPVLSWMKSGNCSSHEFFISHIFLKNHTMTFHLVVFYERNNFLWYAELLSQLSSKYLTPDKLYFVRGDSAFDRFTAISLGFKQPFLKYINIPSSPAYFLHQIKTSRFLECNKTINEKFKQYSSTTSPTTHSDISVPRFNQRLVIALQELKRKLNPLLIPFWIWSGTMLGWYRQCDVIPYTSDVDFAAWAADVEDADSLTKSFIKNKHLKIKQKMGLIGEGLEFNLNCHGLRVDLFFVYNSKNGTWYAGHCPKTGNYFRYHHPFFKLCSAELLGHKVIVPCETENVISAEYGLDWIQPVSSWSYEKSPKNIGPDLFWKKELLKNVYVDFK